MLLNLLPAIVRLRNTTENVSLCWTLQRMVDELKRPKPGGVVVAHALARMMLVEALRVHIESSTGGELGVLAALSDEQLTKAMTLMHREPGVAWTVETLAQCVGMSRAAFAARFTATVHQSPIAYLTHWRISLAKRSLTDSTETIGQIAQSLGYQSVSAFGKVFAKATKYSPQRYRQRFRRATRFAA